jgi:peptidoglycan/LPS O-acetylase OafA/YrhL
LVLLNHVALASGLSGGGPVINAGTTGVAMFFSLSGYLIPTVWLANPDRTYWLRRFARIAPGYVAATVALGLLTVVPVTFADLTMTKAFEVTEFDEFMGVAWTLQLELIFYALVPLLVRLPARWIVGLGGISVILFFTSTDPGIRATFPFRYWMFVPGMVAARGALPGWGMAGFTLLVGSLLTPHPWPNLLAAIGAALLIAWALKREPNIPRFVVYGSTISYGIYLYHHEIVRELRDFGWPPAAILGGGLTLTVLVAALSWHFVEAPWNRWAARISARIRVRRAVGRSAAAQIEKIAA